MPAIAILEFDDDAFQVAPMPEAEHDHYYA